jgi:hypothetical protein
VCHSCSELSVVEFYDNYLKVEHMCVRIYVCMYVYMYVCMYVLCMCVSVVSRSEKI